ncbi:MAG: asparaginase [Haloferacaceae archaeon]
MSRPTLAVLSCGGTIAAEPEEGGAAPAKSGSQLLDAVPALEGRADYRTREVCSRPGFDMRWRDVLETAGLARDVAEGASDEPVDGVVVTHGTDTLADTAYALELLGDLSAPVVVTGAQRRLDEPSSDAPANLVTAVRAAADDRFAPGVHVAFDQELHAARDVVKAHTNALDTFQSPGKGPVATFSRGDVRIHRRPERRVVVPPLDGVDPGSVPRVPIVHSGTGVGSGWLERIGDVGDVGDAGDVGDGGNPGGDRAPGGVVVEGTGLGNVTAALGEEIASLASEIPVVVGSRCHAGTTEPVYGTDGGAVTLERAGVAFAGDLPTSKARVKLAVGLAAGLDVDRLFPA